MNTHATASVIRPRPIERAVLRRMELREQLGDIHEELLETIAGLETACCEAAPNRERYAIARWKVSNASRKRRILFAAIYSEVRPAVDGRQAFILDDLRAEDEVQLNESIAHVRTWSPEDIEADWDGYRKASVRMRTDMRRRVEKERQLLYPIILDGLPDRAA